MSDVTTTQRYHGPDGEVITAYDEIGRQFLAVYAREVAAGDERRAEAMRWLAKLVEAAGGEVRVAGGGLGKFGRVELQVSLDEQTRELVFKTKRG